MTSCHFVNSKRSRISERTGMSNCAKFDEQERKSEAAQRLSNPVLL